MYKSDTCIFVLLVMSAVVKMLDFFFNMSRSIKWYKPKENCKQPTINRVNGLTDAVDLHCGL